MAQDKQDGEWGLPVCPRTPAGPRGLGSSWGSTWSEPHPRPGSRVPGGEAEEVRGGGLGASQASQGMLSSAPLTEALGTIRSPPGRRPPETSICCWTVVTAAASPPPPLHQPSPLGLPGLPPPRPEPCTRRWARPPSEPGAHAPWGPAGRTGRCRGGPPGGRPEPCAQRREGRGSGGHPREVSLWEDDKVRSLSAGHSCPAVWPGPGLPHCPGKSGWGSGLGARRASPQRSSYQTIPSHTRGPHPWRLDGGATCPRPVPSDPAGGPIPGGVAGTGPRGRAAALGRRETLSCWGS